MFRAAISAASTLADSSAGPPAALAEEIGLKNDQLAAFSEVGFLFDNRLSNAGLQLQLGVFTVALFTKVKISWRQSQSKMSIWKAQVIQRSQQLQFYVASAIWLRVG